MGLRPPLAGLRILTVRQPWAGLIMAGSKHYETRAWRPRDAHGQTVERETILVHASAMMLSQAGAELVFYLSGIRAGGGPDLLPPALEPETRWQRGVILGTIDVVGFSPTDTFEPDEIERAMGDFRPGRWAWHLRNPRWLREPVAARGRLGLWRMDPE